MTTADPQPMLRHLDNDVAEICSLVGVVSRTVDGHTCAASAAPAAA